MEHVHYTEMELKEAVEPEMKNANLRWLISKKDSAEHFTMHLFEMQPGGYTPLHQHDWEHEVFILEGRDVTRDKTIKKTFKEGDVFFVPSMEWHQFVNTDEYTLKLLCLIPYKK